MELPVETIFEAALRLPENKRLALALRLLEITPAQDSGISLDEESLFEELERRFAEDDGSVDWHELRAEK
jgi:hypothetical protein